MTLQVKHQESNLSPTTLKIIILIFSIEALQAEGWFCKDVSKSRLFKNHPAGFSEKLKDQEDFLHLLVLKEFQTFRSRKTKF